MSGRSFLGRLWHELEPLVRHAIVTLSLEFIALLIGISTHYASSRVPDSKAIISYVTSIDTFFAVAALALFAAYALIQVFVRLAKSIRREIEK